MFSWVFVCCGAFNAFFVFVYFVHTVVELLHLCEDAESFAEVCFVEGFGGERFEVVVV